MGNYVCYYSATRDIRRELKDVRSRLNQEKSLQASIKREQNDGYWQKKGGMSYDETRYEQALEELRQELPELKQKEERLSKQLEQYRAKYL
jgi:hypothetical protein